MENGLLLKSTYIYWFIAFCGSYLQLRFLNVAMENYDQAEIGPINESSLILLNLICGGIILNEQKLYKWYELLILFMCSVVCIIGIYIFISKPKILQIYNFKRRSSSSGTSQKLMEQPSFTEITFSVNEQDEVLVIQKYER